MLFNTILSTKCCPNDLSVLISLPPPPLQSNCIRRCLMELRSSYRKDWVYISRPPTPSHLALMSSHLSGSLEQLTSALMQLEKMRWVELIYTLLVWWTIDTSSWLIFLVYCVGSKCIYMYMYMYMYMKKLIFRYKSTRGTPPIPYNFISQTLLPIISSVLYVQA